MKALICINTVLNVAPRSTCGVPSSKRSTSIVKRIQKAEVADLAFLVDITGSMQPYIDGTKDAVRKIVDSLDTSEVKKLRMAFVGYRDFGDKPHFKILKFTESVNDFKSFLGKIKSRGGGDTPEDVFGGLEKIGQLDWSKSAGTRVLIHIADNPCHGTKYHNLKYRNGINPQGDPEGRSLNSLLLTLKLQNVDYNFGRIKASSTDKMIDEFSKVWEETIPQFDIKITWKTRTCSGMECCRPIRRIHSVGPRPKVRRLAHAREKRGVPKDVRPVPEIICPKGKVYRPGSSVSDGANEASESIASGALESLRAGYAKARSRLGER